MEQLFFHDEEKELHELILPKLHFSMYQHALELNMPKTAAAILEESKYLSQSKFHSSNFQIPKDFLSHIWQYTWKTHPEEFSIPKHENSSDFKTEVSSSFISPNFGPPFSVDFLKFEDSIPLEDKSSQPISFQSFIPFTQDQYNTNPNSFSIPIEIQQNIPPPSSTQQPQIILTNQSLHPKMVQSLSQSQKKKKETFACQYPGCNGLFTTLANMKRHEKLHSGEKPYICKFEGCEKNFARKYDLKVHTRTHTKEKPYICQYVGCGKRFSRSSSLREHERNLHKEKAKPSYICMYVDCGKKFFQETELNIHYQLQHQQLQQKTQDFIQQDFSLGYENKNFWEDIEFSGFVDDGFNKS